MIITYPTIGLEVELMENECLVLQIENAAVMRDLIQSIWNQMNGKEGTISILNNGKVLKFDKTVELITNIFDVDINNRKILNKLLLEIADVANDVMAENTADINSKLTGYIDELTEHIPYPVDYNLDMDITSILKAYDVRIRPDCDDTLEYIINYIKLSKQICGIEIFVFSHLKDYFTGEELRQLYEAAAYEKAFLVLIESGDKASTIGEKRVIIDKDKCIIFVSE